MRHSGRSPASCLSYGKITDAEIYPQIQLSRPKAAILRILTESQRQDSNFTSKTLQQVGLSEEPKPQISHIGDAVKNMWEMC